VILRLALRSLSTRPLRTAVLAVGFGLGIGVMVELLGVGEVILEQAHAPVLQGGGDLVATGAAGEVDSARFLLSSVLGSSRFRSRTLAISPSKRATLFLLAHGQATAIAARGGVPSREQAIGDPEVAGQASWTDTPADTAWTNPPPGDVLRAWIASTGAGKRTEVLGGMAATSTEVPRRLAALLSDLHDRRARSVGKASDVRAPPADARGP
jgi:hypothetical protein